MTDHRPAVAAIDCGTNSTRLLVARGSGEAILRETRITRLGQGVDSQGVLARDAVERTLSALRDYRATMDGYGVEQARMVATSAARDARNGPDFMAAASAIVGFDAELLSGDDEGRIAFAGATRDLPPIDADDVVVDIGGGSTELIVRRDHAISVVSMDMGCVRLTERRLTDDPPTDKEIANATATIRRHLDCAEKVVPALSSLRPGSRLVGLAGTVATLAVLVLDLSEYRYEVVHHAVLPYDTVVVWCDRLFKESAARRARRPAIAPGREDVIAAGALILREVMRRLERPECLVSETDILDGLVLTLLVDVGLSRKSGTSDINGK